MVLQARRSSSMACEAPTALALLASHTDVCNSVLECDHAALGKSASTCPGWSEPAQVRRLQSMFGAFRRTYAELLQQHPSIPLELHDFYRSRHGPPKTLDVVLSRCHEPLLPLARLLPAMLPDTPWRMRLIVYERCADSEDGTILPSLDVRDSVLHLTRIALQAAPAGAFSEHIRRTLGQGATAQSWQAADALLFIRMRLLDAHSPAVPVVPPATTPATLATTHESVRLQEELLARLHKHWEAAETVRAAELAGGQRARSVSAGPLGNGGGVALDHRDQFVVDAERLGDQLGVGGLVALAGLPRADRHDHRAVRPDLEVGPFRAAAAARLDIGRQPDAP